MLIQLLVFLTFIVSGICWLFFFIRFYPRACFEYSEYLKTNYYEKWFEICSRDKFWLYAGWRYAGREKGSFSLLVSLLKDKEFYGDEKIKEMKNKAISNLKISLFFGFFFISSFSSIIFFKI